MSSRPDPLVSADCDLRDFAFMPLDVARLRDSDLASSESPEACWAAVLLWAASWHQVPAGSIPNDDRWMSQQTGYGRIVKEWLKVRDGALRGWVECSDGRLYHPVVVEKALDAWDAMRRQRWKSECARIKKHNDRHEIKHPIPSFEEWVSLGCPLGQALVVPRDNPPLSLGTNANVPRDKSSCPSIVPSETPSKGQGQGEGQRYITKEVSLSHSLRLDERDPDFENPGGTTPAGEVCKALRRIGIASVSPSHPELAALLGKGVTLEMFEDAATKTVAKQKGFAYMLAIIKAQLQDAATIAAGPSVGAEAWDVTRQSIEAHGVRCGLGLWCGNPVQELFSAYTERVRMALESTHETAGV